MPQTSSLFHARIVEGPREAALAEARRLAAALVCAEEGPTPCGTCLHCRKAAAGIHPDIISVEEFQEKKDIGVSIRVDAARDLRGDVFILPNEARRKVYLIPDAHLLNEAAQNVLLKIMEEGPEYAAFLLVTHRPGALLATVRSRCVTVRAAGETEEAAIHPDAPALAEALVGGDAMKMAVVLARRDREKQDRGDVDRLLRDCQQLLGRWAAAKAGGDPADLPDPAPELSRILRSVSLVARGLELSGAQVGAGHIFGWLAAQNIQG